MDKKNVAQGFTRSLLTPFVKCLRQSPHHVRGRCDLEEARAVAAQMRDPEAKRIMITLAVTYERLAKFAALRAASA